MYFIIPDEKASKWPNALHLMMFWELEMLEVILTGIMHPGFHWWAKEGQ